jgi:hypothetical protein
MSDGQSKKYSLIESFANVAIGYFISLLSQIIIFGSMGIDIPIRDNIIISCWFTVISIVRSYSLRRFFNRLKK